ncbi:hypothetical protein, conserved [Leishmania tarentolae]|uniref:Uncharacterized protein n=1 Tax=Leishmania tarentolae TaxID=5689 RepID=A0A640K7E6_LEITA|nr:hypothetical protein, conserved [Leishmania tarentolae]
MTPAAVPAKTVSATPRRPLFAWTAPLTYELYHLCEDVDRPRSSATSSDHLCPAQVTRSAQAPLEHQRRRRDIVRRLRRVGRLHTIPGLPQPPPLLLRRERATLSTDVPDGAMGCARRSHERLQPSSQSGAGEADTPQRMRTAAKAYGVVEEAAMDVEQEDVLVGTVCSLHDYCHHVTGIGDFAYGESWNTADGAAHLPLSHKDRLTTDAPAPGGRSAHVSEMACNRVRGPAADCHSDIPADATAAASSTPSFLPSNRNAAAPADMFLFPPPLSRGIEKTCRGVCPTSSRERWCVPGDGDARKADFSELEGQPQLQHRRRARSKQGAASAYICPHRLYEDVGHHHWSCIALHAFLEAKVRLCRPFHESRDTTTTASSQHPPTPPQGAPVVAPVTRPQQRAAHGRRGRAAPTTDAGVLPLSSASCRTLSPSASDALEVGCSAAALSASHSVGVLLAHEQEWIYFSVLFHAHALPLPRASEESAASRLASGRSFDLSQLYCFLHPPCRLYTEELEEWAHARRERRRERARLRDGRCIQHGWPLSASAHGAPTQTHSTAARPSRSTDASRRVTLMANAPLSPGAVSTVSPNTWLVYVHPDVSLVTLPRLWSCVFGEDAPSSSSGGDGTGQEAVEGDTARALDGHHDVEDHCEAWAGVGRRGKRADHKGVVLSKLNAAVTRKRRRQAAEVEMLCRYLLPPPPPPPRRNACSLLPVNQAEVPLSARERPRARPLAAASIEVAASTTPSMPSTASLLVSDMTPQRRPTSTAALPHEDDRHREQRWHALACTLTVSPLVRSMNFLKRQHWLSKPFVLAEELKYGRVVKYGSEKPVVPRVR